MAILLGLFAMWRERMSLTTSKLGDGSLMSNRGSDMTADGIAIVRRDLRWDC